MLEEHMPASSDAHRYELLGELGTGGMATVYLARMRGLHGFSRLIAIKCMHPQYAKDAEFTAMFLDEARLSARIRHPNVVSTHDVVAEEGQLLIVLEYIEGVSLADLVRATDTIPIPIACAIVRDVLHGLHAAHEAKDDDGALLGIVHRDVSPQNALIGVDGLARVLDFGVAKARTRAQHTGDGEIKGKVPYMPPEQLFGGDVDRRVDVYAAGVVLWELLSGKRLFTAESDTALIKLVTESEIARPSVHRADLPDGLEPIVMRALSRLPEERFATAEEMAAKIEEVVRVASRTEVAEWTKKNAADAIENRRAIAHKQPSSTPIAPALESALKTFAPLQTTRSGRGETKKRVVPTLIALILGLLVLGLVVGARFLPARTEPAVTRDPPPPATPALSIIPPPPPPSIVSIPPLPIPSASAPARPPAIVTPPPVRPAADSSACRPPFTVDSAGRRHYRAECL